MRTLRTLALIPALGLALVACGSDSTTSGTEPASSAATTSPSDSTAASTSAPADTMAPADTTPDTVPVGPVQIDVVVGKDSGPDRVEKVRLGSEVQLNITNPDAADEFHIHTIDLEQAVDAGVTATFNFTADTPGTYEVESHATEAVLVVIEVG